MLCYMNSIAAQLYFVSTALTVITQLKTSQES